MPKWVYPLAFVFLLYVVFNDGSGAGQDANDFAGFLGEMLSAIGDFLTGMFEGNESGASTSDTSSTGGGDGFDSGGLDTTDHTHQN